MSTGSYGVQFCAEERDDGGRLGRMLLFVGNVTGVEIRTGIMMARQRQCCLWL